MKHSLKDLLKKLRESDSPNEAFAVLKNIRGGGPPGTTNSGPECVNTASCNNTNMSQC